MPWRVAFGFENATFGSDYCDFLIWGGYFVNGGGGITVKRMNLAFCCTIRNDL